MFIKNIYSFYFIKIILKKKSYFKWNQKPPNIHKALSDYNAQTPEKFSFAK